METLDPSESCENGPNNNFLKKNEYAFVGSMKKRELETQVKRDTHESI